jgi:hypothetical protein
MGRLLRDNSLSITLFGLFLLFLQATAENWESEFLQMAAYVLLTAFLFQRGSPESKPVAAPHAETGTS